MRGAEGGEGRGGEGKGREGKGREGRGRDCVLLPLALYLANITDLYITGLVFGYKTEATGNDELGVTRWPPRLLPTAKLS